LEKKCSVFFVIITIHKQCWATIGSGNMTEKDVQTYILNHIDIIFNDTKRLTTGNLAHHLPSILHDIAALKTNVFILLRDNTNLSKELWEK
jgi:hypothetical protein